MFCVQHKTRRNATFEEISTGYGGLLVTRFTNPTQFKSSKCLAAKR